MAIVEIEYGSIASSQVLNDNFESLESDIQELASTIETAVATMQSNISSLSTTITSVTDDVESLVADVFPIGAPRLSLDGVLDDGEIWLEGAEVSKDTYSALYEVYGDTYGTPDDDDNFLLPDFRGRVLQGYESDFGHIEAGLPELYGSAAFAGGLGTLEMIRSSSGVFSHSGDYTSSNYTFMAYTDYADSKLYFRASDYNSIYGNSSTVQPPAIIVRVKTRYI